MALIPMFKADYPGAIVAPCDASNCYNPANHGGVTNRPLAFVLHTPEEPADNWASTPRWFAQYHPAQAGSTTYFVSFTGDVYQILPESWGAIANGLDGKPRPAWAGPSGSLNWLSLSVEIEGYANSIGSTLRVGSPQWQALVRLIKHRCAAWRIPLDRQHVVGHYELSTARTDPGATFPWAALMHDLGSTVYAPPPIIIIPGQGATDMIPVRHNQRAKFGGVEGGWTNRQFEPRKEMYVVRARGDMNIPEGVSLIEVDTRIDPTTTGSIVIYDGGMDELNKFADALSRLKPEAIAKVFLDSNGDFRFRVSGAPVKFRELGSTMYWR